jgi:hypothetical protein
MGWARAGGESSLSRRDANAHEAKCARICPKQPIQTNNYSDPFFWSASSAPRRQLRDLIRQPLPLRLAQPRFGQHLLLEFAAIAAAALAAQ